MVKMASLDQQLRRIEKQLGKHMKIAMNDVAKEVKKEQAKQVKSEVYDAYEPVSELKGGYKRRFDNGGLSDEDNMKHIIKTDGNFTVLEIVNMTMSNPDFMPVSRSPFMISGVIEFGHGWDGERYDYSKDGSEEFAQPRPFIQATRDELVRSGKHIKAFRTSMQKQGFDIR